MLFARDDRGQLGGILDDLQTIIDKAPGYVHQAAGVVDQAGGYLATVKTVLEDPALPAVVERINTIHALEVSSSVSSGGTSNVKGVGLSRAIPILDAYIWYRRNPWVPWAALGTGAFLVLSLLRKRS